MRACVRLDDTACSGCFAVDRDLRQGCVLTPPLFIIFFAAAIHVAYTRFKADKDSTSALVHLRRKQERGMGESNQRGSSPGDLASGHALRRRCRGRLTITPEQLRRMTVAIVVVCAAFGLTVSELKTKIMYLRTKGMLEFAAIFSVEAAAQVCNQTNEFIHPGGDVNHNTDLSIRNAYCSFRKYTLELYDRPSAPPKIKL